MSIITSYRIMPALSGNGFLVHYKIVQSYVDREIPTQARLNEGIKKCETSKAAITFIAKKELEYRGA